MSFLPKPKFRHPAIETNDLGFSHRDYEGAISTLCAGCGHDSRTRFHNHYRFVIDLLPCQRPRGYWLMAAHGLRAALVLGGGLAYGVA